MVENKELEYIDLEDLSNKIKKLIIKELPKALKNIKIEELDWIQKIYLEEQLGVMVKNGIIDCEHQCLFETEETE